MTKLKPTDFSPDDILEDKYTGIRLAFKERFDWVVKINKIDLVSSKLKAVGASATKDDSREVYVYQDIVKVSSSDVYKKPKCDRV